MLENDGTENGGTGKWRYWKITILKNDSTGKRRYRKLMVLDNGGTGK